MLLKELYYDVRTIIIFLIELINLIAYSNLIKRGSAKYIIQSFLVLQ